MTEQTERKGWKGALVGLYINDLFSLIDRIEQQCTVNRALMIDERLNLKRAKEQLERIIRSLDPPKPEKES
jgi:hypothetical protein